MPAVAAAAAFAMAAMSTTTGDAAGVDAAAGTGASLLASWLLSSSACLCARSFAVVGSAAAAVGVGAIGSAALAPQRDVPVEDDAAVLLLVEATAGAGASEKRLRFLAGCASAIAKYF